MARDILGLGLRHLDVPADIHVIAARDGVYSCESTTVTGDQSVIGCGFEGSLGEAIEHVVAHQFRVK